MEADFWHARWRQGNIGFHRDEVNPWLRTGLPRLVLSPGARVLVPLCGKSLDLGWLADQGLRPFGVELSPIACAAVFEERGVRPERTAKGSLELLAGDGIEVCCGDFLDPALVDAGPFDAVWDRAALIALPGDTRPDYVAQCARLLAPGATGLLVSLEYDPREMEGPPFSVTPSAVRSLYGSSFDAVPLVEGQYCEPSEHLQARGLTAMHESVWQLTKRAADDA